MYKTGDTEQFYFAKTKDKRIKKHCRESQRGISSHRMSLTGKVIKGFLKESLKLIKSVGMKSTEFILML